MYSIIGFPVFRKISCEFRFRAVRRLYYYSFYVMCFFAVITTKLKILDRNVVGSRQMKN